MRGGQAPVTNAHIYLYAAGTTGYNTGAACPGSKSAPVATCAVSLLTAGSNTFPDANGNYYVVSDSGGNFTVSGDYTCTKGTQVYMVGVGGNATLNAPSNTAITQLAALGECPASKTLAQQVPYLVMNEVSTVAMAYAVGGFGSNAYNISSSGSTLAQAGIANAFANISSILQVPTGQALASVPGNANSISPQGKLYAMANVLASCVNSNSNTSAACTKLFGYATSDGTTGGTQPTDEAGAIFNIVSNPTANVANLYASQGTTPPFTTGMTKAPTDWTMPVVYTGVVTHPFNIAFDAVGTAWISDTVDGVVRISAQGSVSKFVTGNNISGIAVDPNGILWAPDAVNNRIYTLDATGLIATYAGGGLNSPSAIAFDGTGNAYVANGTGVNVSKFNSSGTPVRNTAYNMPNITDPLWIAVDSSGNSWVPSSGNNYIGELAAGATRGTSQFGPTNSYALAVDANDNVWVAGVGNEIQKTTNGAVKKTYTGGGLNAPYMISIDGAGSLWVANSGASTVSGFTSAGAAISTAAFQTGAGGDCYAATPDGSGNLWTANTDGSITMLLGLAAPTATPMLPGQLGIKP